MSPQACGLPSRQYRMSENVIRKFCSNREAGFNLTLVWLCRRHGGRHVREAFLPKVALGRARWIGVTGFTNLEDVFFWAE